MINGSGFPRLQALIEAARDATASAAQPAAIGMVLPCDPRALQAAHLVATHGVARPVLVGPRAAIERAADSAQVAVRDFELVETAADPHAATHAAARHARDGTLGALMKGSLRTDEFMGVVVAREAGLRTERRITHTFLFDLPRYHKLLALADCVVNIAPRLDLLLMPDLNAANTLYKSCVYVGGGECAGLVLGARVPIVLTSRADSILARVASVALAVLAMRESA